ncbi:hypothetical protein [Aeromonas salmonicida]
MVAFTIDITLQNDGKQQMQGSAAKEAQRMLDPIAPRSRILTGVEANVSGLYQAGFLPWLLAGTIGGQKTSILRTQPSSIQAVSIWVKEGTSCRYENYLSIIDNHRFH